MYVSDRVRKNMPAKKLKTEPLKGLTNHLARRLARRASKLHLQRSPLSTQNPQTTTNNSKQQQLRKVPNHTVKINVILH